MTKPIKRLPVDVKQNLDQKNAARRDAGVVQIVVKIRTCLSCGNLFESLGNRTCGCTGRIG